MAYSKVAYGGHTLIDLTQDTAVEADVASGKTFHKADGTQAVGTATGGGGTVNLQNKTVNLGSSSPSAVSADSGYDGLGQVSFNVSGISANKIKDGESVCGVQGSYKGTASFPRTISLTVNINAPEPGHINVYWRQNDENNPGQVCWDSYEIFYSDGANTDSSTITLCADDYDPSNVIVDGFYIGPLWDGAVSSDITVVGGGLRYIESNGTGTETAYIVALSSTVTITINIPT